MLPAEKPNDELNNALIWIHLMFPDMEGKLVLLTEKAEVEYPV